MYRTLGIVGVLFAVAILPSGCKRTDGGKTAAPSSHDDHGHHHDDGDTHDADHGHDEVPLGMTKIGTLDVELAQGHGMVEAGKEGHLVVKLPYNDKGQSVVRAWIGTKDRMKSLVGKGTYAPSHDDYDVHAVAPAPLPADVMWWIEIERPDGTKALGSAKPLLK